MVIAGGVGKMEDTEIVTFNLKTNFFYMSRLTRAMEKRFLRTTSIRKKWKNTRKNLIPFVLFSTSLPFILFLHFFLSESDFLRTFFINNSYADHQFPKICKQYLDKYTNLMSFH